MSEARTNTFSPAAFLGDDVLQEGFVGPDLLILNQPISSFQVFARLWRHARYRICADGGANRLYDMFEGDLNERRKEFVRYVLPRPHVAA
jgi:thiamine pyrophosphokinase